MAKKRPAKKDDSIYSAEGELIRDFGHDVTVRKVVTTAASMTPSIEYRVLRGKFPVKVFYSPDEADSFAVELSRKTA